jgi:hypothetical protein
VYDIPPDFNAMEEPHRIGSAVLSLRALGAAAIGDELALVLTHQIGEKQSALTQSGATVIIRIMQPRPSGEQTVEAPKPVVVVAPIVAPVRKPASGATSPKSSIASPAAYPQSASDRAQQTFLTTGSVVNLYSPAFPQGKPQFLYYAPPTSSGAASPTSVISAGRLYFSDIGNGQRIPNAAHHLPLSVVSEMIVGRQTGAFPSSISNAKCVSLRSSKGNLDIECRSTSLRDDWSSAILNLLRAYGRNVRVQHIQA